MTRRIHLEEIELIELPGSVSEALYFEIKNSLPPSFEATPELWDQLNAAIVKAVDRSTHKFTRNNKPGFKIKPQSAEHIFLILDEGVAWMGSTILTESAIFHQNPYLSCFAEQVEPSSNVLLAFDPWGVDSSSRQVDHLTATATNERLGSPHLTTVRDKSGLYKDNEKCAYRTSHVWPEFPKYKNVSPEMSASSSQQWLLLTLTKKEVIDWICATHHLPIGASAANMRTTLATNLPAAPSESQLENLNQLERSLHNKIHVFDFRSHAGGWPETMALELSIHVHPEAVFDGNLPSGPQKMLSFLPESVKTDGDLTFFLRPSPPNLPDSPPFPFASSRLEFSFRMGEVEGALGANEHRPTLVCFDELHRVFLNLPGIELIRAHGSDQSSQI